MDLRWEAWLRGLTKQVGACNEKEDLGTCCETLGEQGVRPSAREEWPHRVLAWGGLMLASASPFPILGGVLIWLVGSETRSSLGSRSVWERPRILHVPQWKGTASGGTFSPKLRAVAEWKVSWVFCSACACEEFLFWWDPWVGHLNLKQKVGNWIRVWLRSLIAKIIVKKMCYVTRLCIVTTTPTVFHVEENNWKNDFLWWRGFYIGRGLMCLSRVEIQFCVVKNEREREINWYQTQNFSINFEHASSSSSVWSHISSYVCLTKWNFKFVRSINYLISKSIIKMLISCMKCSRAKVSLIVKEIRSV